MLVLGTNPERAAMEVMDDQIRQYLEWHQRFLFAGDATIRDVGYSPIDQGERRFVDASRANVSVC
jgi:hypothetical protein